MAARQQVPDTGTTLDSGSGTGPIRVGGIDFGTRALHAVFLTGPGPGGLPTVEHVRVTVTGDEAGLDDLVALGATTSHLGIDAPDAQTGGCPLPGVRPARCAEVALAATGHGLDQRIIGGPIRMLTPSVGAAFPARLHWMMAGFSLWAALRDRLDDVHIFETWPSGSFTRLAHARHPRLRLRPRSTAVGVAQRAELVAPLVDGPPYLAMWGLDGLDALAAALAAYRLALGHGFAVAAHDHDGHDGSRITLVG